MNNIEQHEVGFLPQPPGWVRLNVASWLEVQPMKGNTPCRDIAYYLNVISIRKKKKKQTHWWNVRSILEGYRRADDDEHHMKSL